MKQTKSELMCELATTTQDAVQNYVQYADEYAEQLGDGPYLKIMDSLKKLHEFIEANYDTFWKSIHTAEYFELMKVDGKLCEYFTDKCIHFIENACGSGRQITMNAEWIKAVAPNSMITEWLTNAPATYAIRRFIVQSVLFYGVTQNLKVNKEGEKTYTLKRNKKVSSLKNLEGCKDCAYFVGGWAKIFQQINEQFTLYDTIRELLERKPEDADDVKLAVTRAWVELMKLNRSMGFESDWDSFINYIKADSDLADHYKTRFDAMFKTTREDDGSWTMEVIPLNKSQQLIVKIIDLLKEVWRGREGRQYPIPRHTLGRILDDSELGHLKLLLACLQHMKSEADRGAEIPTEDLREMFVIFE